LCSPLNQAKNTKETTQKHFEVCSCVKLVIQVIKRKVHIKQDNIDLEFDNNFLERSAE